MKKHPPVLTIAGSDCSGGAGIQADLKTMTTLGCYGMSVITALTAQNTKGVQGVYPVPPESVLDQLRSIFSDIPPRAVKIGMLHDRPLIEGICSFLKEGCVPVVLDPVMVATSGDILLNPEALDALMDLLFPLASLITPNVHETRLISGAEVRSVEDLKTQSRILAGRWNTAFLVKGGDLDKAGRSCDVLCRPGKEPLVLESPRINTENTHGTGCTLSSAIASYLALELPLEEAVSHAKGYIQSALIAGKDQNWGSGRGPVNHMWNYGGGR